METDTCSTPRTTPGLRHAAARVTGCVTAYGVLGAVALVAVAAVAAGGHPVNTFMWVRAALLPLVAVVMHRLAVAAFRDGPGGPGGPGSRRAFERLRTLAGIMPVAIVGVDLVPGVCPLWYAAVQTVCVLPVVRIAFLARGAAVRTTFPRGH
ncbi:hypothetical protein ACF08W_17160 [Streptomyces sp. NPDC015144]|uniref:hypothetical protein n=1 Tax=Streptomyces sp. NPDC015144 TaxID=3364944 RepID=UPI003700642A